MSSFLDNEASEGEDEDELTSTERKRLKKLRHKIEDSSDEEEDDENVLREEMKDLIDDNPIEEDDDDEDSSASSDADSASEGGGHGRRKRSHADDELDDGLEDEDYDLLEENLGVKVKRQKHLKRIRRVSDSDEERSQAGDADEEEHVDASSRDYVDETGARMAGDVDSAGGGAAVHADIGVDEDDLDEEDIDDFLVDEDGKPISKGPKKKRRFADAALQEAQDIFGVDFDYAEFDKYDDEESEADDEAFDDDNRRTAADGAAASSTDAAADAAGRGRKRAHKKKKSIFEIYEPSELERGHFTDRDTQIRRTDVPERMQLRVVPVTPTELGADDPQLQLEADWIVRHAFTKPTISTQSKDEDDEERDRVHHTPAVLSKVKAVLDLMRNKHLEVPFIASYKKEYIVPDLTTNDLWKIYSWDEKWCQLQQRKRSVEKLLRRMQVYQAELVMADATASLPEGTRVVEEVDIERVQAVDSLEELRDIYLHFRLYYGSDVQAMHDEELKKKTAQKKNAPKKTKKATRIETNEDGEDIAVEVEVTDDEADPKEEEDGVKDSLKHALRTDSYTLCRRHGLESLTRNFGLSPLQFGENLRDTYQRHDVDQYPVEPEEMARDYVTQGLATPEAVLQAVKHMVARQLSCEPLVRRCAREMLFSSARLTVRPTKKGVKEIDEGHPMYTMKYSKDKPVGSLRDDQFLRLSMAEEEKLVTLEIGSTVTNYAGRDYVEEAKSLYCKDEFSRHVQRWNELRGECVQMALVSMVFPSLRTELRTRLKQEAYTFVLHQVRRRLFHWLSVAPYSADQSAAVNDDEDEDEPSADGVRVMAVAYDTDPDTADYACVVDANAEVVECLKLQCLLRRKDAWREVDRRGKLADLAALRQLIATRRPHVIVVGGENRDAISVVDDLRELVAEISSGGEGGRAATRVELLDNQLAKVFANSQRGASEFRDYPLLLRQAVSLARRMHDPLLEFAQLCNADEDVLCLRYHALQEQVPREQLADTVTVEFVNRTNEVGVDINEALNLGYRAVVLPFVCGLGVRKANALFKTLKQTSQRLANRTELVTNCHLGPKVLTNCAGFIRIDASALGDMTDRYTDLLDGTRIHLETYEWARKMAVDALEYDDEDANPTGALEEIMENPERLKDLDLDAFADELQRQGLGNRSITLYDIRAELTNRFKDMRTPYTSPDPLEVFNMLTKETPDTLYRGKLLLCTVTGYTRRKPKPEQMNQDNPVRDTETGFWQCPFCLRKDFLELSEVWSHFDTNSCPGKAIGVRIRLDNGCTGFVPMRSLSDSRVTNPEERVRPGQSISCRVVKIDIEKFWTECTCRSSDLADKNYEWRPPRDSYYDTDAELLERQRAEAAHKQKHAQTYMKRVIVHPAFHNVDFRQAKQLLTTMDQGEAIIRPSSQGAEFLTVSWKVTDGIIQHISVKEKGKENAFSLGHTLIIDGDEFEDLDEILARHVGQLAAHARDLLNYKYYRDTNGGQRSAAEEVVKEEKQKCPSRIPYIVSASKEHPGKFMLSYLPRTRCRHEFITVTCDGFRFRQQIFDSLPALFRWFKDHFRDPPPQSAAVVSRAAATPGIGGRTPFTPGLGINGDAVARVAHNLSGSVLHNLSQVAASRSGRAAMNAAGAGGYAYPNTPYTPSGQTPFMTPYATTPHHNFQQQPSAAVLMSPALNHHHHHHHKKQQQYDGGGGGNSGADWAAAAEMWARARRSTTTGSSSNVGTPQDDMSSVRNTPVNVTATPLHDE